MGAVYALCGHSEDDQVGETRSYEEEHQNPTSCGAFCSACAASEEDPLGEAESYEGASRSHARCTERADLPREPAGGAARESARAEAGKRLIQLVG